MPAVFQSGENSTDWYEVIKSLLIIFICFAIPFLLQNFLPFRRRFNKGLSAVKKKDFILARELFSRCLESKPDHIPSLYNRTNVNIQLKNFDEAINDCNKIIKLKPTSYEGFLALSVVYYGLGNNSLSVENINKALNLNPPRMDKHLLLINRGVISDSNGQYANAIEDYKNAIELLKNHWTGYNNLGYALLNIKKFKEAITYFDQAIKLDREQPYPHNNRGFAYSNLDMPEKAFEDFKKSYNIDPSNSHLYKFRGLANLRVKKFQEALIDLEKAIEKDVSFMEELEPIIKDIKQNLP